MAQNKIDYVIDIKNKWSFIKDVNQLDDLILNISLINNGIPYDLTGQTVIVNYVNANNTIANIGGDKVTVSENRVEVICPTDCTRSCGKASFNLVIKDSQGQVSTFIMDIQVNQGLIQNQEQSKNASIIAEDLNNASLEATQKATELANVIATADTTTYATKGEINGVKSSLEESNNNITNLNNNKVDKVVGKGLSTHDYISEDKVEVGKIKTLATKEELKVVDNRISNIIVNNNPTEGNTELIDARAGANGVVYPSVGVAVRSQIGTSKKLINDSNNGYTHFPRDIFYKGGINDAGEFVEVNYRIGTKDKIFADRDMYVIAKDGYKLAVAFYNNEKVFTFGTGYHYSCFIAKGSYFNIAIQTEPDSWGDLTEENIQEYINSVDVTSKEYMQLLNTINNNSFLSFDKFSHKSQTSGRPHESKDARILLNEITLADKDITLSINRGFKFSVQFYDETGTFTNETTWMKEGEYTISKGSRFRILIGDDKEKLTNGTVEGNKIMDYILYRSLMTDYSCIPNVYKELESIKENIVSYNYSYQGEKINTKRHGINCKWVKKFSWASFADKLANTGFQGIAEQNNVVVSAHTSNYVSLHDFDTCEVIAHFVAPKGDHGNSCGFLDKKYDSLDEFNILWITPNTSSSPSICFYRLTRESATLIKKLTFDLEDCGYYSDFCVNNENMHLYGIGFTKDSYNNGDGNPMKCAEYDISNILLDGGDTIHISEPLKTFTVPFITTGQGRTCFNGIMYLISSKNSGYADTKIYGIDYSKKKIVTILDQFSNGVKSSETEGLFFKENDKGNYDLYLMDIYGETYKVEFE